MKQLHVLPLVVLGAVGYLIGIALIVMPFVLELQPDSPAMLASVVLGVVMLALTLTGNTPVAAARLVPTKALEAGYYLIALLLVLFPFAAALTSEARVVLAYVLIGVVLFVLTLLADFPRKRSITAGPGSETAAGTEAGPSHADAAAPSAGGSTGTSDTPASSDADH